MRAEKKTQETYRGRTYMNDDFRRQAYRQSNNDFQTEQEDGPEKTMDGLMNELEINSGEEKCSEADPKNGPQGVEATMERGKQERVERRSAEAYEKPVGGSGEDPDGKEMDEEKSNLESDSQKEGKREKGVEEESAGNWQERQWARNRGKNAESRDYYGPRNYRKDNYQSPKRGYNRDYYYNDGYQGDYEGEYGYQSGDYGSYYNERDDKGYYNNQYYYNRNRGYNDRGYRSNGYENYGGGRGGWKHGFYSYDNYYNEGQTDPEDHNQVQYEEEADPGKDEENKKAPGYVATESTEDKPCSASNEKEPESEKTEQTDSNATSKVAEETSPQKGRKSQDPEKEVQSKEVLFDGERVKRDSHDREKDRSQRGSGHNGRYGPYGNKGQHSRGDEGMGFKGKSSLDQTQQMNLMYNIPFINMMSNQFDFNTMMQYANNFANYPQNNRVYKNPAANEVYQQPAIPVPVPEPAKVEAKPPQEIKEGELVEPTAEKNVDESPEGGKLSSQKGKLEKKTRESRKSRKRYKDCQEDSGEGEERLKKRSIEEPGNEEEEEENYQFRNDDDRESAGNLEGDTGNMFYQFNDFNNYGNNNYDQKTANYHQQQRMKFFNQQFIETLKKFPPDFFKRAMPQLFNMPNQGNAGNYQAMGQNPFMGFMMNSMFPNMARSQDARTTGNEQKPGSAEFSQNEAPVQPQGPQESEGAKMNQEEIGGKQININEMLNEDNQVKLAVTPSASKSDTRKRDSYNDFEGNPVDREEQSHNGGWSGYKMQMSYLTGQAEESEEHEGGGQTEYEEEPSEDQGGDNESSADGEHTKRQER